MTIANPRDLMCALRKADIAQIAGVPCSSLTGLINEAQKGELVRYINAPNEGEGVAYAAGLWLGGSAGAFACQNSGVGNLFNALTSLLLPYQIPAIMLVGWRGRPGHVDEPQHLLMGKITDPLFELCQVPTIEFGCATDVSEVTDLALACFSTRRTSAVLLAMNAIGAEKDGKAVPSSPFPTLRRHYAAHNPALPRVDRRTAIERIFSWLPKEVLLVAATGFISRECFDFSDRPGNFYMTGSMGHAAPVGLGMSVASGRPVVVVDGDGAVLMRLGGMAMVGAAAPITLIHMVLDNGIHASTGGQPSLAAGADLANLAISLGYRTAVDTADLDEALEVCRNGLASGGPVFVRLRIRACGETPPRIRLDLPEMAARIRAAATVNEQGINTYDALR